MTSSRRISAAASRSKPSRTKSNRAKLYIAIPPKTGWPAFDGQNWAAPGVKLK